MCLHGHCPLVLTVLLLYLNPITSVDQSQSTAIDGVSEAGTCVCCVCEGGVVGVCASLIYSYLSYGTIMISMQR